MSRDLSAEVKQIIESNKYLTLATVLDSGKPWVTPLWYAYDPDFTFYFTSPKDALHINALEHQKKTMAVIYPQEQQEGYYQAVFITGTTERVPHKELPSVLEIIYRRKMKQKTRVYETIKQSSDFKDESPMRVYRLVPDLVYALADPSDVQGHTVYKRQLVELA